MAAMGNSRYGLPIIDSIYESEETAKVYVSNMIDSLRGGSQGQAKMVAESIAKSAENATDERLFSIQEDIKNIKRSKIFTAAQSKVNDYIFKGISRAKDPAEIRKALIRFGNQYDAKQYEKFVDFKYKEISSNNLIENMGKRIMDQTENLPEDF